MFSLGLLAQEFGQLAYAYLNFYKNTPVPYPSIGDIGYFGSILLYTYGVILLAKASGVKIRLNSFSKILQAILFPLIILSLGYSFFLPGYDVAWSNPIKIFLDFGYPLGQSVYISLAILTYILSKQKLGGLMKNKILFVLIALFVQFLCDYTFLYQSSRGIWVVGGFNDYMYLVSYFLMTLALLQLNRDKLNVLILTKIKSKDIPQYLQCEDIFGQLAQKIIREEEKIIGNIAWDLGLSVPGLIIDANYTLCVLGNKNQVINQLISQYEKIFGSSSRELAKDSFKTLSTIVDAIAIEVTITLNLTSARFFIRQISTENFISIYPLGEPKLSVDRDSPVIRFLSGHGLVLVKNEIPKMISSANTIAEAKVLQLIDQEMERLGAEAIGGVFSDHALLGMLILGARVGGKELQSDELAFVGQVLDSSTRELAQVIHFRETQASILRNSSVG